MAVPEQVVMPTAAQLVADAIRRRIVTGELADGESLPPEASLIAQYGVSRPTFREALRILQSESLISIRRGSRGGARVNAPAIGTISRQAGYVLQHQGTTLGDAYRAICILEPPAARMLATTTKARKRELRALLDHEQDVARDPAAFARASGEFHEGVLRLAGNNTLALLAGILHGIIERHSDALYSGAAGSLEHVEQSSKAHRVLVELVDAADAEGAEAHWRAHLEEAGAWLARTDGHKRRIELFD